MSRLDAQHHAHIYFAADERPAAAALRDSFTSLMAPGSDPQILYVGRMADHGVGPHPIPQYEIHFLAAAAPRVISAIEGSGLRALIHPLTDDDLADHTRLAQWIGEPIDLDLSVLDPPGVNQGVARFAATDF